MRAIFLALLTLAPFVGAPFAAASPYTAYATVEGPEDPILITHDGYRGEWYDGSVFLDVAGVADVWVGGGWRVTVYADGAPIARTRTDALGHYVVRVLWTTPGPHVLQAVAEEGTPREGRGPPLAVTVITKPGAPEALGVTQGSPWNRAVVSWSPPTDTGHGAITDYRVERSTDGGAFQTLATLNGSARSYASAAVPHSTSTYRVLAATKAGWGAAAVATYTAPSAPAVDALTADVREYRVDGQRVLEGHSTTLYGGSHSAELWMSGLAWTQGIRNGPGSAVQVEDLVTLSGPCAGSYGSFVCPAAETHLVSGIGVTRPDGSYSATLAVPLPPIQPGEVWRVDVAVTARSGSASASDAGAWWLYADAGGDDGSCYWCGGNYG